MSPIQNPNRINKVKRGSGATLRTIAEYGVFDKYGRTNETDVGNDDGHEHATKGHGE